MYVCRLTRTERRLPRLGVHVDRRGERTVGRQIAEGFVQVAVEVARFVHDCRLDRVGQRRYRGGQILQTDVGRRIVLFQRHVVWGKWSKKKNFLKINFCFFFCFCTDNRWTRRVFRTTHGHCNGFVRHV